MGLPLAGRRVLVTRAEADAREWAELLTQLGAEPVILPCIRTETIDGEATRAALSAALRSADWLCVTSPRGTEAVARLAGSLPAALQVAAVGHATAASVRELFRREPFVAGGTSRALGVALRARLGARAVVTRVVIAAAKEGRTDIEAAFDGSGVQITRVAVYQTMPAVTVPTRRDLSLEGIADVLLASPSALEGLLNQASLPATARFYTVGPTTSAAVRAAGLRVSGEATHPDFESLVEAMQ